MRHHGGMLLMNRAVTFSLDIGMQDLTVDFQFQVDSSIEVK